MTRRFDQAWNLMLMAITLSALATPATAESDSEKERTEDCATAVMTEYVKANDALLQETATVMPMLVIRHARHAERLRPGSMMPRDRRASKQKAERARCVLSWFLFHRA